MDPSKYINVQSEINGNYYYKLTPKAIYTDINTLPLVVDDNSVISGSIDFRNITIKPIRITYKNDAYRFYGTLTAYLSSPMCVRATIINDNLVDSSPTATLSTNFQIDGISQTPCTKDINYVTCTKASDRTINLTNFGDLSVCIYNDHMFIDGLSATYNNMLIKQTDAYVSFGSDDITKFNENLKWNKKPTTISTSLIISELCCKIDRFGNHTNTKDIENTIAKLSVATKADLTKSSSEYTYNISCKLDTKVDYSNLYLVHTPGKMPPVINQTLVSAYNGVNVNEASRVLLGNGYYHFLWNMPNKDAILSVCQVQFTKCENLSHISAHSIQLSGYYRKSAANKSVTKHTLYNISDRTHIDVISCKTT